MKKLFLPLAILLIVFLSAFTVLSPPDWTLTDGYSIRVKGKGINGFFHSMRGKVSFDENKLATASCNLEIDVASITTGNTLKSWKSKRKKWFDAKQYPTITFASSKFQKAPKGYTVTGKLKMKGVEKEVSIPFQFNDNVFYGSFYVLRSEYKVGKMKGLAKMVSDTIKIDFTIPVKK